MYYGMTYNQFMSSERTSYKKSFQDVYDALGFANNRWVIENEDGRHYPRFLVVVREDNEKSPQYAFFEFSNYRDCQNFIANAGNFSYSPEENKIWNGSPSLTISKGDFSSK